MTASGILPRLVVYMLRCSFREQPSAMAEGPGPDLVPIDQKPTIKELQNHVVRHVASKWEELGIQLNLDDDGTEVDNISTKRGGNEAKCCLDVLKAWLQGKGEEPKTWRTLVDCLKEIEAEEAIRSIEDNILKCSVLASQPSEPQSTADPSQEQHPGGIAQQLSIRNYQWELAEPGINGENYIICAPTGTGKTLVAGLIISEHLQKRKRDENQGKVIFMVTTRPLAQQQKIRLNEIIPQASVECCVGDDGSTIELQLKHEDIVVCTAGKLLNELKENKVQLEEIGLIVIDECHHTVKESPQAKVMEIYLEWKQQGKAVLPQIVGLTASPGAGDNPSLELEKTLHHLISLCALMDATSGIKTVTENLDDLEQHKNKSTFRLQIPNGRDCGEEFIQTVVKQMIYLEQLVNLRCPLSRARWSQQYESAIQQMREPLEVSLKPEAQDSINILKVLRCYTQALNIYMDLRYEDAFFILDEFLSFPSDDKATPLERMLKQKLEQLKAELKQLPKVPNPLLVHMEEILRSHFESKPDSIGICFVRTKKHASGICDWISKLKSEIEIRPKLFVGHTSTQETGPGMTQVEQEDALQSFREGEYNLLVATSVAEEGLDIPACNLVIRFQHVSNEIARVQTQGRARAENSQGFTILSSDSKKPYQEMKNEELDALVTEALIYLPAGRLLRDELQEIEQKISHDRDFKKRLALAKKQPKGVDGDSVKLMCRTCKVVACKGSDIYSAEGATQYIVADDDFTGSKIEMKPHPKPKTISDRICKKNKIYCKNCNADWGITCVWPKAGCEFPVLKCKSFVFVIGGIPRLVGKWSDAPFDVLPLSSHPKYQGFED